jgi:hypothetical protein
MIRDACARYLMLDTGIQAVVERTDEMTLKRSN